MRRPRLRLLLIVPLALFFFSALAVPGKAKREPCPPGRYLLPAGSRLIVDGAQVLLDAVVLQGTSVGIDSGCSLAAGRIERIKRGTLVTAGWSGCGGRQRVRLRALIEPGCGIMTGTIRAKKLKRSRFTATLSVCSDGVVDPRNSEECDGLVGCDGGGTCTDQCRCQGGTPTSTPGVTTTSVTTTTVLAAGRDCTAGDQCVSGSCIDGVCCTQAACAGQCEACDADPLDKGECKPVTGLPHGLGSTRPGCTGDGSGGCGGACDGALRTTCIYPTGPCRTQSCATSTGAPVLTLAASCDGAGSCPLTTQACAPPSNMVASCDGAGMSCSFSCQANYADCSNGRSDGCETNIGNDPNNCGACGTRCSDSLAGSICSNQVCSCAGGQVACLAGQTCYAPSSTRCCAPDGSNGCGCTRGSCRLFNCGSGSCVCYSWNYTCSGAGPGCDYTLLDSRYGPAAGHCGGFACSLTGNLSFYCDL